MSVSSGTILLVARAATGQPNVPDLLLTVALPLLQCPSDESPEQSGERLGHGRCVRLRAVGEFLKESKKEFACVIPPGSLASVAEYASIQQFVWSVSLLQQPGSGALTLKRASAWGGYNRLYLYMD